MTNFFQSEFDPIQHIIIGRPDYLGLHVVNIFVKKPDYCIYEVEHIDVYYRLRIAIAKDVDPEIRLRLDQVQQDLLQALALLKQDPKRHSNLIQRIAYTVSICLRVDQATSKQQFSELTDKIIHEHVAASTNQRVYSGVTLCVLLVIGGLSLLKEFGVNFLIIGDFLPYWFAGLLGGVLSMFKNANSIDFSDVLPHRHYVYLALERLIIVGITTFIAYVFIQSNLIFPEILMKDAQLNEPKFKIMAFLVIAGFSETLVPSVLNNFNFRKT